MWTEVVLVFCISCLYLSYADNPISSNVLDIAANLGATKFLNLVNKTGLTINLTQHAHVTVFVPSNEAFENMPQEQKDNLDELTYAREILLYHVIPKQLLAEQFKNEETFKTLSMLEGSDKPMEVRINNYNNNQIKTVSGSPITSFDHVATNGVVHVISRVMYMLPVFGNVAQVTSLPITRYMSYGILDGGLEKMLDGKGPYTIFAPSDLAFEALPNKTFNILRGNKTAIRRVMENHIINGTYFSAGLTQNKMLTTMLGLNLKVNINKGKLFTFATRYKIFAWLSAYYIWKSFEKCVLVVFIIPTLHMDNITVNGSFLAIPDFTATNGVVHFTTKVFFPTDSDSFDD